ncbi:MAG: SDR family NAD(P)-dependent oxidoreductase [Nitrososphaeraceae archaeon]
MVNAIGGYLGAKSAAELDENEWDLMMNMNLKSAFLISKHVIPIMASAKYGKIIHVASRTGFKSDGHDSE